MATFPPDPEPGAPRTPRLLRITTWNCRQGYAGKADLLAGIGADVAVIPESGPGILEALGGHWLRQDEDDTRGLGMSAQEPWSLTPVRFTPDGPLVVPVLVDGPVPFTLLAVWATPGGEGPHPYARQMLDVLGQNPAVLPDHPLVVAGDFNLAMPMDDGFAAVADALGELGLVSAWHEVSGEEFGQESVQTHVYGPRKNRSHIDYIWIPRDWLPAVRSIEIGREDEWIGQGRSDHCPITIELSVPRLANPGPG